MISQRLANLIFAIIMMAVVVYMGWIAWGFQTPALGDATLPTKFFPLVLLGFIAFCITVYACEYMLMGGSGGDGDEVVFYSHAQARRGLLTLIAAVASYLIWQSFGFIAAGVFATPAVALAMGNRRAAHLLVIFAGSGVIFLVFTYVLGTQFK